MDLSMPLRSLIPSLDSSVLTVLVETEAALGQSQVQRLAPHGSRSGLALALARLVEHGLVLAESTNFGYAYRLNRAHVLAPPLLAAAAARHEFMRRLTDACERLRPHVLSAAVFGSVARRASDPSSDVDLLLVTSDGVETDSPAWRDQITGLQAEVLAWSGNHLQTISVTPAHLVKLVASDEPIVESWRRDAITLTGRDLQRLLLDASAQSRRGFDAPTANTR